MTAFSTIQAATARVNEIALARGIPAPASMLTDGAPSDELLSFAAQTGTSLDYIFTGEGTATRHIGAVLSPIRVMFDKWEALNRRAAVETDTPDDEDPVFGEVADVMDQILAATPRSMADLALQILVADDRGDMSMNVWQERLAEKAKGLANEASPRDLHDETDLALAEANDMLSAAHELGVEHPFLGSSDPSAQSFLTLIRVSRERVRAAMDAHGKEWTAHHKAGKGGNH